MPEPVSDPSAEPPVLLSQSDGLAMLTLNRPTALNALSVSLLTAFDTALDEVIDSGARALMITGAGRGFCSGADLAADAGAMAKPDRDLGEALEAHYHPLLMRLRALPCPIVTAVNGPAAGAGMSLALMGDLVVAAQSAYFLQAFVNIGLVPDAGSTYLLPRLLGQARALRLMMLGEKLPAPEAEAWGLIYKAVPDEALAEQAEAMARRLAAGPTQALARIRQLAQASADNDYESQLAMERDLQREAGRTDDFLEGVQAFLQKREARFKGR